LRWRKPFAADHAALVKSADWILSKQGSRCGDWQVKEQEAETGGWVFWSFAMIFIHRRRRHEHVVLMPAAREIRSHAERGAARTPSGLLEHAES